MEMDGDFSHNPDDIPRFIEAAKDADLVLGSRYCNGIRVINWPLSRLFLSTGAGIYVRTITGMPFTDPTGGFKCFRRRALESINLEAVRSNGYSFQIEMTHKIWQQGMTHGRSADYFYRTLSRPLQNVGQNCPGGSDHGLAALDSMRISPLAQNQTK